jgi:flagellar biosynthesis protein FlhG
MAAGYVWAVAGGKGGAGRTLLAANLAIQMARSDRNVILVDLDLECGQLHGALGFTRVRKGLPAFQAGDARLAEAAVDTSIPHLKLVGGLQTPRPLDETAILLARVREGLAELEGNVVIIDCGSGRSRTVLEAFSLAERGLLVSTPEPPALEATVLFVEAHLRACFERALPEDTRRALGELLAGDGVRPERLPFRDLMVRLASLDPKARKAVATEAGRTRLELVLNMVRDEGDEEAGAALAGALRKGLGVPLSIAGFIEHDPSVVQSVLKRRPLSQQFPNTPATRGIGRAATRLLAATATTGGRSELPEWEEIGEQDHYRVLEISPKASSKEIQASYHSLRRAFDTETTPLAPLIPVDTLRAVMTRIEDAYRTLIFLESRVAYDREMVDSGRLAADQIRGLHAGIAPSPAVASPRAQPDHAEPAAPSASAREGEAVPATGAVAGSPDAGGEAVPGGAAPVAAAVGMAAPPGAGDPTSQDAGPAAAATSGDALRAERQRLGQTLEAIALRTKIRVTYLQAIEEERFERLPPPVFLRGFVREFAACLGLPADETARAILKRREARIAANAEAAAASEPPERRSA